MAEKIRKALVALGYNIEEVAVVGNIVEILADGEFYAYKIDTNNSLNSIIAYIIGRVGVKNG